MSDRLIELEAIVTKVLAEIATLKGEAKPNPLAALFPGKWRKTWCGGETRNGSEEFIVENDAMRVTSTTTGMCTTWQMAVVSDDGAEIQLHQSHRAKRSCFPDIDITIRRYREGFAGIETARGEKIEVVYEPITA